MGAFGGSQPVRALVRKTPIRGGGLRPPRTSVGRGFHGEGRFAQWRPERFQLQADLQMGDDQGRRQDLEPEDALDRGAFEVVRDQRVVAFVLKRGRDAAQHRPQIGPGAAAGIEHDHTRVGEAVGDVQFRAQNLVDALDLVAHDLFGGVPDPQFLAQFRIEGLQERLVEILHRVPFVERLEEGGHINAPERGGGTVEDVDQSEPAQLIGIGSLHEQRPQHGHAQKEVSQTPVERAGDMVGSGRLAERLGEGQFPRGIRGAAACPQDPGRKDAVEQSLDQSGPEEMLPLVPFEAHAESVFESLAQRCQGGKVGALDLQAGVMGVRCQDGSHVPRFRERSVVQENAAEEFPHALSGLSRGFSRMPAHGPEFVRRICERVRLEDMRPPVRVGADQGKCAEVGHEHHAVALPIAFDLRAAGDAVDLLGWSFGFDHAARRILAEKGIIVLNAGAPRELIGGEQAAVRQSCAAVCDMDNAPDPGRERPAESRKQIFQG